MEMTRADIEVFSPMVTFDGIKHDNRAVPLFPGYLFMKLDQDAYERPSFRYSQHVLGLLNFGGEAPWLPDEIIDALKERCDNLNERGGIWRRYHKGDWVQVVNSTIQGIAQVVEDGKSSETPVRLLLQLFERLVPIQISRHNLQPLENPPASPRKTRGRGRWVQGFGPRALSS
jgi:transcriptional antiterminator RfaH